MAEKPSVAAVTAAAYVVLFLFGLIAGVLGGFQHAWYLGSVPISAVGWVVLLAAVCYGAGRGMGGKLPALVPGLGWLAITMIWLGGRAEGDVVIANDLSGYVYLYGGLAAILVGVLFSPSGGGAWLLAQRPYGSHPAQPGPSSSPPS
ncbi:hypothetical protein FHR32_001779 [Streptosporangium album]|uniref:Uncharacterized protein n=1 Tax=Streptosporangium album TaxID=47479 RepID=A0A7W7RSM9_9ACTN|nr:DUF6113 family protein [Streptosporangium album]MBB4937474.1 hypothetical protein [Streptosporangium album]